MSGPVAQALGITVTEGGLLPGLALSDMFDFALRINPRRPHLLVSRVLGKHVPTDPWLVHDAGLLLGLRVVEALGGQPVPAGLFATLSRVLTGDGAALDDLHDGVAAAASQPPGSGLVMGYAETATGLGHLVAKALGWPVIHSTRRSVPGFTPALSFDEPHSHATGHLMLPADPELLRAPGVMVLVDDELSTGTTALNTIRAMQAHQPRQRYVITALIDVRRAEDRARMAAVAAELGVAIDVVALASGEVHVPADAAAREVPLPAPRVADPVDHNDLVVDRGWPWRVPETGRHGLAAAAERELSAAAGAVAARLDIGDRVLVLGTEELMHAPLQVAVALRERATVRFSSTTRSPVRVADLAGYPIRSSIEFEAHDRFADAGPRFAYNVVGEWSDIVVVLDSPNTTDRVQHLLDRLVQLAPKVHVVVIGSAAGIGRGLRGPDFGSYAPDEVTWLLKDLSAVALEGDLATREALIQAGQAHYAESLPIEYQPEPAYQQLFTEQLAQVAPRVATAVATVADLARRTRGRNDLVLVSLARAGTPIGILMRRWAHRQGWDWPHYAISIVRDRGIDLVAMRYLAERHDSAQVLFVDGWTGKGAITREFTTAISEVNAELGTSFDPELAVLADPGECVRLFGTRDDFLIPSACLNSTVSGLVSRTVLNDDLIGPGDFHGAKFYADLREQDVSGLFIDTVADCFADVETAARKDVDALLRTDREPTWVGWAAAERIRAEYGIPHINLVKPGVGETTRVLLRRVPWQIVVNPDRAADLRHIELLAAGRGVPVVPVPDLPYSCIGLIRPTEQDGS